MDTKGQPTITLYRAWDTPGKYVWSPFVTKVEFRLRTSKLHYKNAIGAPHSGPKGKIPYLDIHSPNQTPETLPDSTIIHQNLTSRGLLADLNGPLSPFQKAQDLAIRALLEDRLVFLNAHERWVQNYYTMRDHALWSIPYPLRNIIGILAHRGTVRKLYDQGTGRFSDAEIRAFVKDIWEGVAAMLEESRREVAGQACFWVLGGNQPTEADATVFGFVVSAMVCDAGPESRDLIKNEFPVVVEYAERIHREWFPDYEIWG